MIANISLTPPFLPSVYDISVLKPDDPHGHTLGATTSGPEPPCVPEERVQPGNASAVDIAWVLRECTSLERLAPRVSATVGAGGDGDGDGGGAAKEVSKVETLADGTVVATVSGAGEATPPPANGTECSDGDRAVAAAGGRSRVHIGRRFFYAGRPDGHTLAYAVENGMAAHGWNAALVGLCPHEVARIVLPPHRAFADVGIGPRGAPTVAPDTALVLDVYVEAVLNCTARADAKNEYDVEGTACEVVASRRGAAARAARVRAARRAEAAAREAKADALRKRQREAAAQQQAAEAPTADDAIAEGDNAIHPDLVAAGWEPAPDWGPDADGNGVPDSLEQGHGEGDEVVPQEIDEETKAAAYADLAERQRRFDAYQARKKAHLEIIKGFKMATTNDEDGDGVNDAETPTLLPPLEREEDQKKKKKKAKEKDAPKKLSKAEQRRQKARRVKAKAAAERARAAFARQEKELAARKEREAAWRREKAAHRKVHRAELEAMNAAMARDP